MAIMLIRRVKRTDMPQIARLYYETIHRVNSRDYTAEPFFRRMGFQISRRLTRFYRNRMFKQAVMEKRLRRPKQLPRQAGHF